ncbi:MAG: hypothetical protein EPN31_16220 [Castellaniella sp.]|uniref:hypothetical protein n=1 Tax=Castellaniella sp. TaxID=1955812 RepID=UPI001223F2A1|nr:hypothetical protein [Castellaniella sp.]TAN25032.1 MAG: hypothetical protein EPN31_16220 [Castellaniella sp.]
MPKRSNDFQRLVYLVRVNLAEGAKVVESKMMRDRLTKGFREVDVVIEGSVGGQPVTVCVECRDHRRVADVSWIEQMKSKHERLNTNALLLASRSGFTPEALKVAKAYDIDTFTLEEPDPETMKNRLAAGSSLWLKTVRVSPGKVTATVEATAELPEEVVATSPDNLLYLQDGTEVAQIQELVNRLLSTDIARDRLVPTATEDHIGFELEWTPPRPDTGEALYMKKIEPAVLRAVSKIRVVGPCAVEIGRFDLRHGRMGSIEVAWGKTKISGRDAMAVTTLGADGKQILSINFSGAAEAASAA